VLASSTAADFVLQFLNCAKTSTGILADFVGVTPAASGRVSMWRLNNAIAIVLAALDDTSEALVPSAATEAVVRLTTYVGQGVEGRAFHPTAILLV
jgi:hypothetical protein